MSDGNVSIERRVRDLALLSSFWSDHVFQYCIEELGGTAVRVIGSLVSDGEREYTIRSMEGG